MKTIVCCALLLAAARTAWAGCPCDRCGCASPCQKVCRVICEVKKVPKVTFDCECEEFCVPGKSCRSTVCDECGNKKHVYTPTCGEVRTRTKLVRKETFEEKVTYRWVVERLCNGCAQKCGAAQQPEAPASTDDTPASVPEPPRPPAPTKPPARSESRAAVPPNSEARGGLSALLRRR